MRITTAAVALLPLTSAFVIHDADVFKNIEKSGRRVMEKGQGVFEDVGKYDHEAHKKGQAVFEEGKNALDDALEKAMGGVESTSEDVYKKIHKTGCDVESWLEESTFDEDAFVDILSGDHPHDHPRPPKDGPPHRRPPPHGKPPHDKKPNLTVYELIAKSKYTTKLAKLINEYLSKLMFYLIDFKTKVCFVRHLCSSVKVSFCLLGLTCIGTTRIKGEPQ